MPGQDIKSFQAFLIVYVHYEKDFLEQDKWRVKKWRLLTEIALQGT